MSSPDPGSVRVAVSGLELRLGEDPERLGERAAERLGVAPEAVRHWRILRRSLDARGRREPRFVHRIGLVLPPGTVLPDSSGVAPWLDETVPLRRPARPPRARPLVVGAGPAGLFAALRLSAYGLSPVVLERGAPLEERVRDVARYWRDGVLDPESNVLFGEGGAGTFSDGKLTYRGKDFRQSWVLERLVEAGAPEEIRFEARPHLGTDRLRSILRRLRADLERGGATIRFHTRVDALRVEGGRVAGVETREGPVRGGPVFLAPGHSARDLITALVGQGVPAAAKGFAVGLRVELSQATVDACQFGPWAGREELPRAEFSIKARGPEGRDVYSFCMCPGGVVIPAGSEADGVVVNGMSASGRSGHWANAALVVTVTPDDFEGTVLGGFRFQREWERRTRELAGERAVPAQRVADFVAGRVSKELPRSSCPWRPVAADLSRCLPEFASAALRCAFPRLTAQLAPLAEGLLLGVETRTSSPTRLLRGGDLQSPGWSGLYPLGEGAGHAGGIVSAAVDGARAADAYLESLGGGPEGA